jgi:hypothetical protein
MTQPKIGAEGLDSAIGLMTRHQLEETGMETISKVKEMIL